jgi:hypothetical protein
VECGYSLSDGNRSGSWEAALRTLTLTSGTTLSIDCLTQESERGQSVELVHAWRPTVSLSLLTTLMKRGSSWTMLSWWVHWNATIANNRNDLAVQVAECSIIHELESSAEVLNFLLWVDEHLVAVETLVPFRERCRSPSRQ